jgi:RNA ligase
MITLSDLFPRNLFKEMLIERYIRIQTSPDGKLTIANYTEKAQFDRVWNSVTLNCRGLIFDTYTEEVVARGFKKFFNWDDSSQPYPPTGPCLRMPKMDGSLGILYKRTDYPHEGYYIATRGSFTSEQAIKATRMFDEIYGTEFYRENDGFKTETHSYLFEIIYPENRIVVNYGDEERLVLLDVLEIATGKSDLAEFDACPWPDKVEKITLSGFQDTMASAIPSGEEGFVFYWPQKDFRVKMKAAEYIELHRMIFGLSARSVWERLGAGETVDEIAEKLPDEFHDWVREIANDLIQKRDEIERRVIRLRKTILSRMPENYTRKMYAGMVMPLPDKALLFLLEDGKDIKEEIWKSLRPAGNIGVMTISEDVA